MAKLKLSCITVLLFVTSQILYTEAESAGSNNNGTENRSTQSPPTVSNLPSFSTAASQTQTSTTESSTTTTGAPVPVTAVSEVPVIATSANSEKSLPQASEATSVSVPRIETPPTVTDFIVSMMKKFGPAKAVEAFQSLDTLPLGVIMKILLVEVDQNLAADIVAMQNYAQRSDSDKAVIKMIGRIVAGDKTVPKEIFTMDQKLMKFPWWMRIRQRMMNNLEKYVAAYSLVPVSVPTATIGIAAVPREKETFAAPPPGPELAAAVAASATESYSSITKTTEKVTTPATSRLSLLTPIEQQKSILALAQSTIQLQQLLQLQQQLQQQQEQPVNQNPLLALLG